MDYQRPVIGILCMDKAQKLHENYTTSTSYISSNYCKMLESASADVVPIWIDRDESYYRQIMKCVNGIIFPGGAVFFDSSDITSVEQTNCYVFAIKIVLQIASQMNDAGTYFPLFGICLGFQFLVNHSADTEVRVPCERLSEKMNIILEKDFKTSKMFHNLPDDLQTMMQSKKFAVHTHMYCITREQIKLFGLADQWKITATNRDAKGKEFISVLEHTKYPFYGTQFHPERVTDGTGCVAYLMDFFISECRKNGNGFPSEADRNRHLIANFVLTNTGLDNVNLRECYIFDKDVDYPALDCSRRNWHIVH